MTSWLNTINYIVSAGNDYRFDDCGNQISCLGKNNKQQRVYNGFNQLTQLNHNGKLTHYEYDALGRRSAKITEQGRIDFIWDNNQLIGEHHNGKFTWFIYQPDTFLPIALIKNGSGSQNNEIYYYHLDQLGTPICLTDSNATQVWRNESDEFGCQQTEEVEGNEKQGFINTVDNPLRFQGQYFDEESKLHYNRFRYYDPKQQRFINQDPIGLVGGINHYQYAPNPVNWIDPFGLSCKELTAAEESASYQGQDPYFGIDPLDNIAIPKHTIFGAYHLEGKRWYYR
ncbi:RHS domain-containing protein [Colwellia sp. MSW7]|uniref:RHS domain-containing protein n=1 Tax=Colwellia maritima TaxID=2912588 RepID=A0ABS9X248_9GAMM|nr:RHS repeat-associated core domain-containing protein [Colwellia maritima]MCI2284316.1 RHS domain-containing protein [Colwellia maritima]